MVVIDGEFYDGEEFFVVLKICEVGRVICYGIVVFGYYFWW